jgi:hypothetical protein
MRVAFIGRFQRRICGADVVLVDYVVESRACQSGRGGNQVRIRDSRGAIFEYQASVCVAGAVVGLPVRFRVPCGLTVFLPSPGSRFAVPARKDGPRAGRTRGLRRRLQSGDSLNSSVSDG